MRMWEGIRSASRIPRDLRPCFVLVNWVGLVDRQSHLQVVPCDTITWLSTERSPASSLVQAWAGAKGGLITTKLRGTGSASLSRRIRNLIAPLKRPSMRSARRSTTFGPIQARPLMHSERETASLGLLMCYVVHQRSRSPDLRAHDFYGFLLDFVVRQLCCAHGATD